MLLNNVSPQIPSSMHFALLDTKISILVSTDVLCLVTYLEFTSCQLQLQWNDEGTKKSKEKKK